MWTDTISLSAVVIFIAVTVSTVVMQLFLMLRVKERKHEEKIDLMERERNELQNRMLLQHIELLRKELKRLSETPGDKRELSTVENLIGMLEQSISENLAKSDQQKRNSVYERR